VGEAGPRLQDALGSMFGTVVGRDATADALAYAWEHWDRVSLMDNRVGYLFVVGRDSVRKSRTSRRVVLASLDTVRAPWVEPGLPAALAALPRQQRTVVMLLHSFDWTMSEAAEVMGVSKGTVQSYEKRAMGRLRRKLGVLR
jgi:DNA-directed RNA polymerase specialized sigma24 family protein